MLRPKILPWRGVALPFFLSRLIILCTTWISLGVFPLTPAKVPLNCVQQLKSCLLTWHYWDTLPYVAIAHYGYRLAQNTVFFPFWPFCLHLLGSLFGGTDEAYFFSGFVLANLCFYLSLVLFFALANKLFDTTVARKALFCLAFYPYSVFFFTGYTESLFLLLSLATFFCLQSSQCPLSWWLAGLSAALAALTRPTGVMLVLPYLVFYLQWWREQRQQTTLAQRIFALAPLLLLPLAVACYLLYLGLVWKNPFLFILAEQAGWGRHLALPWLGLISTITALLTGYQLLHNLLDLLFTLIPLAVLALGWKRLSASYSLYALALFLFSLSSPSVSTEPLASAPRYFLTIFPCFLLLGLYCKRPLFERIYTALSPALLVLFTIFFVHHFWLA